MVRQHNAILETMESQSLNTLNVKRGDEVVFSYKPTTKEFPSEIKLTFPENYFSSTSESSQPLQELSIKANGSASVKVNPSAVAGECLYSVNPVEISSPRIIVELE